jgi:hypothetical protein
MATRRSFSNYKASGDNRWSRTAFEADLIVALGQKATSTRSSSISAFDRKADIKTANPKVETETN